MKIGPLIKYHRTKQKMTQGKLCEGICSITHLSKIENNTREGNSETIELLLERLGVSLQEVEDNERNIRHLLNEFLNHIQYFEKEKMEPAFEQLENFKEFIVNTDYLYLYELYKLRYFLSLSDKTKAEEQMKWLQTNKQNFSQHERYLLSYLYALFLILQGKYNEADIKIQRIIQNNPVLGAFEGEVYYHLAVVKGYLDQTNQAILYGKKALEFYKNQYNFKRIIHALMALAINYSRGKVYDEALETYGHLLRSAEMFDNNELLPQIYHNIGDLHLNMGDYIIAQVYFNKSLSIMTSKTENYLLCLFNIARTEYFLDKTESSIYRFKLLKEEAASLKVSHYRMYATFYLYLLDGKKEVAMNYLETKLLPYLANIVELIEAHQLFSSILSDYYKQEGKYDKAVQYLL
ncbi:Helix-turn-helix [Psychrobacillus sp. OK028]|uniref:helix-turn-helix domain-containing protein n=1 Tax=Psychrobacillus sp. OK028 TaxID=1884359 RepID=UPI0008837C9E|nr:helix-turn-helix transcriptional regulator [Psychrobacillus sp. OK028]SDM40648.1 Helix-turn-helix [Psychrobacillus sp. OK028]